MAASENFPAHLSGLLNNLKMVKVMAGKDQEQKTFVVHRDLLLSSCSPNIKKVLDKKLLHGFEEELKYEECDPLVCQIMIAWLYTREVHLPAVKLGPIALKRVFPKQVSDGKGPVLSVGSFKDAQLQYLNGALTWILADQMGIRDMKNDVINRLYKILEEMPRKDLPALTVVVNEIQDKRFLYDFHIWFATTSMSVEDLDLPDFPSGFLPEVFYRDSMRVLAVRWVQGRGFPTPSVFCENFHDHAHSAENGKACTGPEGLGRFTRTADDGKA